MLLGFDLFFFNYYWLIWTLKPLYRLLRALTSDGSRFSNKRLFIFRRLEKNILCGYSGWVAWALLYTARVLVTHIWATIFNIYIYNRVMVIRQSYEAKVLVTHIWATKWLRQAVLWSSSRVIINLKTWNTMEADWVSIISQEEDWVIIVFINLTGSRLRLKRLIRKQIE